MLCGGQQAAPQGGYKKDPSEQFVWRQIQPKVCFPVYVWPSPPEWSPGKVLLEITSLLLMPWCGLEKATLQRGSLKTKEGTQRVSLSLAWVTPIFIIVLRDDITLVKHSKTQHCLLRALSNNTSYLQPSLINTVWPTPLLSFYSGII